MKPPHDLRSESESDRTADSEVGSNERTNERTDASDPNGWLSGTGSRRERAYDEFDGMVALGSVIAAGELWRTDQRHERIRIGERAEIPSHVRSAVWFRDRGRCADCHPDYPSGDALHLDHIKPWSAGGADTTDNLRLLCERHNLARSNFIDFARPKRPATWWCANCYDLDRHQWEYHAGYVTCPIHTYYDPRKTSCRVVRHYWKAWTETHEMPTWHQRQMLTSFEHLAYCAHCNAPGMTGVVL